MIFYSTATGNDQYVAERVAQATGDTTSSITQCIHKGTWTVTLKERENLGFVLPTYFWGLPSVVADFLQKLNIEGLPTYSFLIATYGTTTGAISQYAKKLLRSKDITLDGLFSVKMPDTWTVMFDLSSKENVAKLNQNADAHITKVAELVKAQTRTSKMPGSLPLFMAWFAQKVYPNARKTSHLHVSKACIGCGLCSRQCPVSAIQMSDNKHPIWVKETCAMRLGCLHRCPTFAIQYDQKTQSHGQYTHPGVKLPR